jgi:hypothetical protein
MTPNERLPLHRKVERAITLYLQAQQTRGRLAGLTVAEGHTADEPRLPWLAVYARNPRPVEEMPPETRIKSVELVLHQKTHSDDEARADADRRLRELDEIFADPACIIEALNIPSVGPDRRQVKELYIYAIHEGDQPEEAEGEAWNDQHVFEVICQDWDPDLV